MKKEQVYSLVLFLLPLVFMEVAHLAFHFNGLYGQDAHRYFQFVGELKRYFQEGISPGEFHWPVLYPLCGLMVKSVLGINAALALQLISATSLGVSGVLVFKIINAESSVKSFLFVLVFLTFCPQLLVASVLCMSDLFSMMWVLLSWFFYLKWKREDWLVWLFGFVAAAALATISRYPAFLLVVIPLGHVFLKLFKAKDWRILLIPVLFLVFCLPELVLHPTWESVSGSYQLNHWSVTNWFKSYFETNDGRQQYRFINLIYIIYPFWHPAYFFTGIVLVAFSVFKFSSKNGIWILPISIAVYLLFLGGVEFQNRRFFVLVFPLILIWMYQLGFREMLKKVSDKVVFIFTFTIGVVHLSIAGYYFTPHLELNQFERQLTVDLKPYEGNKLYCFYWDLALKSYGSNFDFHNLWEGKVKVVSKGDFVLFNYEELRDQWHGSQLMVNWNFIEQHHKLEVVETWGNGWRLYEIQ